jgi:hypothetical protein
MRLAGISYSWLKVLKDKCLLFFASNCKTKNWLNGIEDRKNFPQKTYFNNFKFLASYLQ